MMYLGFALFFAFNFSLWFMLPSFLFKSITKKKNIKRKDKVIKHDFIIYSTLTVLYIMIYLLYYRYFYIATKDIDISNGIGYITSNLGNLSLILIFFTVISVAYGIFTFKFSEKLFKVNEINFGYTVISIYGFLSILTYFFSNSVLLLTSYSFDLSQGFLNLILNINNEFLLFLFPFLVFAKFALSFNEEK
ncbi:MAG: hypothetical protein IJN90_06440 [Bacilli bacterium]|nr:hypothetical protein [Bacilli bacterium]